MKRLLILAGSLTLAAVSISAVAPGSGHRQVSWRTIVGTRQTGNLVGAGSGQIPGAGQPFSTIGGSCVLDLDTGYVRFSMEGLSFAGGNAIGTTGPFTQLQGVLLFDVNGSASGGNAVRVDLPNVPLSSDGNAAYGGFINLPAVAQTETDIAFLIVNPGNMYVANGAVRTQ